MGRQSKTGTSPWRSSEGLVTFAVAFAVFTVNLNCLRVPRQIYVLTEF